MDHGDWPCVIVVVVISDTVCLWTMVTRYSLYLIVVVVVISVTAYLWTMVTRCVYLLWL